ncbi:MAG: hypothetical protein AAGC60_23325 [Acidobacteriota bacterium]
MSNRFFRGLIVLVASVVLASSAYAQTPFTTTTIVNGNLSPIANGAALLNAVATATPPALIKVEPGTYDLDGGQLVLRNLVDIEGSGRGVTFITSDVPIASASDATVLAPAHVKAQLRGLTVRNDSAADGTAIRIESDFFLLTSMKVETETGGSSTGVDVFNCNTVIRDVFVRADAKVLSTIGIRIFGGAPVLESSISFVSANSLQNFALMIGGDADAQVDQFVAVANPEAKAALAVSVQDDATVQLRNVRGTAISATLGSYGLHVIGNAHVDVKESTFTALNDSYTVTLYMTGNSRVETTGSTFTAGPMTTAHSAITAAFIVDQSSLDSDQSIFESTSVAVSNFSTGTARFGASQIIGTMQPGAPSSFQCIFSYDGSYSARAANCL